MGIRPAAAVRWRRIGALLLVAALAAAGAGCAEGTPQQAEPGPWQATPTPSTPSSSAPSASPSGQATTTPEESTAPSYSRWELGASPLPTTTAGYGEIRPTPRQLRVRRFPTVDLLPPPAEGRFASSVGSITPQIRKRMGETWSPRCPVALADLRYVTVSFRGFDGAAHTGELVVAASAADDLVSVFAELFEAGYPIEEMRLPTTADLRAAPTGDGNNTAGLVCRASTGASSTWSAHAYGLAIDLNPFLNPYVKGDLVLPELASAYLDRTRTQPGIIHADDVVVRAFARIGWSWGGAWRSAKDYQHFSATGR
ncbi:M15 family metallopeptidase [Nocardioides sp. zg-ZUI104]|uniref:M15 family metallopeptidase n=1 Tax=Nocardioides faecalis TaxID=2803858 RepID=UPI001BCCDF0D|nr:M15 family metallopeptidase [Nocardioides faecalis]MBS4753530.1 M15 family metallopeptidase [Nocardioides faecalis]